MENNNLTVVDEENNEELAEKIEYTNEEVMGEINVDEELKRIKKQDNPSTKIPKDIKASNLYKDSIEQAYAIGECFQVLMGYGVDYVNAISIGNNIIQNKVEIEKAKTQAEHSEQSL